MKRPGAAPVLDQSLRLPRWRAGRRHGRPAPRAWAGGQRRRPAGEGPGWIRSPGRPSDRVGEQVRSSHIVGICRGQQSNRGFGIADRSVLARFHGLLAATDWRRGPGRSGVLRSGSRAPHAPFRQSDGDGFIDVATGVPREDPSARQALPRTSPGPLTRSSSSTVPLLAQRRTRRWRRRIRFGQPWG